MLSGYHQMLTTKKKYSDIASVYNFAVTRNCYLSFFGLSQGLRNWGQPSIYFPIGDHVNVSWCRSHTCTRAFISSSYIREESPILSLSWWGWRSCYESVVLGAPFTPAASTAEAERRVAHSISCDITL